MSSVAGVVREFLDRLERGEGSVEDRSLADRLAWWASGWRARGACAPSGNGVHPAVAYGVPFEQLPTGPVIRPKLAAGPVEWSEGRDPERVTKPFPHRLSRRLLAGVLVDEPPAEVVASVAAPAKWNKPGTPSQPDIEFAEMLRRDYAGEWVEVQAGELTWTQRHWLAQKFIGSGSAYRPVGSFEARLVAGSLKEEPSRLFVRAVKEATDESVPVEPVPAVEPSDVEVGAALVAEAEEALATVSPSNLAEPPAGEVAADEPPVRVHRGNRTYKGMGPSARQRAATASVKSVAVIDPPQPAPSGRARPASGESWPEWSTFAEEIQSYDGEWVEVEVSERNTAGRGNLATAIRGTNSAFRPAGEYESTVQGGRLYARWRKGSKRG